jgi:hypothetical protein
LSLGSSHGSLWDHHLGGLWVKKCKRHQLSSVAVSSCQLIMPKSSTWQTCLSCIISLSLCSKILSVQIFFCLQTVTVIYCYHFFQLLQYFDLQILNAWLSCHPSLQQDRQLAKNIFFFAKKSRQGSSLQSWWTYLCRQLSSVGSSKSSVTSLTDDKRSSHGRTWWLLWW